MRPVGTAVGEPERATPERPPRRRHVLLIVAVAVAVALSGALWWVASTGPAPLTGADVDAAVQRGIEQVQEAGRDVPPEATLAYQAITPSLVTVTTQRLQGGGTGLGQGSSSTRPARSSPPCTSSTEPPPVEVSFADGTRAEAQVTGPSPDEDDIAVLGVDRLPDVVVPAVLGGGAGRASRSSPWATPSA